ncbi:MAG: hypothetical protein M1834_007777 [Cirrosporium novae-zelandiae]|nr:MAG: hypothetical protein M1834_007777 [Cirrosporium novae-zelandiae]
MPLKDILKKKDRIAQEQYPNSPTSTQSLNVPQFTFVRTDTHTEEIIHPPSFAGDATPTESEKEETYSVKRLSRFRRKSSPPKPSSDNTPPHRGRRMSERFHIRPSSRGSSDNVPSDLPQIPEAGAAPEEQEAQWEERATKLAQANPIVNSNRPEPSRGRSEPFLGNNTGLSSNDRSRSRSRSISNAEGDDHIQEAIRLHEEGRLEESTAMFGRLADPNGVNNALSQVLYGLALRHGWGIEINTSKGLTYLSLAASNSAAVEEMALQSGMKKGGAAKGELVLAIYELANSFRNGWGVHKDPVAAKQYYEAAANLGDTDAMNEVAWCYLEGFGCKKDKVRAIISIAVSIPSHDFPLRLSYLWFNGA